MWKSQVNPLSGEEEKHKHKHLRRRRRSKEESFWSEEPRRNRKKVAMSEEGPKLFTNKPKKKGNWFKSLITISLHESFIWFDPWSDPDIIAQLKHVEANGTTVVPPSNPAAAAAASYTMGGAPPPPPPPKESFARRYKYMWPLLLTVNLAVGGKNHPSKIRV